jgi:DNA-binding response OmpR family regulator
MTSEILLADDDRIILAMHQAIFKLSHMDLEVKTFEDGTPLLDYLSNKANSDTHYIILLDLNMPVLGGLDVLVELQHLQKKRHFSVLVVSSSSSQYDKIKELHFDFVKEYITKPFKVGDLSKVIALVENQLKKKLSA